MGAQLLKILIITAGPQLAGLLVPRLLQGLTSLVESTETEADDMVLQIVIDTLQELETLEIKDPDK